MLYSTSGCRPCRDIPFGWQGCLLKSISEELCRLAEMVERRRRETIVKTKANKPERNITSLFALAENMRKLSARKVNTLSYDQRAMWS